MAGSFSRERRDFLTKSVLATAAPLVGAQAAEAQAVNSGSTRVYRSGETIDDRVAKISVAGWGITYDWNETLDYLGRTGRKVDVVFKAEKTVPALGDLFVGETAYRDGKRYETFRALPTTINDRAYVHIFESEGDKNDPFDNAKNRIVAERVYPVALDFHTSGDPFRRTLGGHTPNRNHIAIFSEIPLDQGLLGKVLELHSLFSELGFAPPIYIENATDQGIFPSSRSDGIRIASAVMTYEKEGLAKLYAELSRQLPEQLLWKDIDPRANTRLRDIHSNLMQSAQFDNSKYQGFVNPANRMTEEQWRDYKEKVAGTPTVKIFDLDSYIKGDINFRVDSRYQSNSMYFRERDLFASAMAVFRYYPEEFLDRFRKMNPTERVMVFNVGNAVLDYLASFAGEGVRDQLKLTGVLPYYHVIKQELNKPN
ncbi:hypothetical protein HYX06_02720 [Candidatus Woesearchaeota archaeon]|nr:hypothetical protein [Candidatus Woesearchaeota archaeon]